MSNNAQIDFILSLADSALILGQRNAEWCGHGPILEQDIAITNITLDLIGQARLWYQYAADLLQKNGDTNATEDSLAYLRHEREFKNLLLCELPKGDWGHTILRQFLFSSYQQLLFQKLAESKDENTAAISKKSLKEISYHVTWSGEWVVRLGDGTEESHRRMLDAIDALWTYTGEMFMNESYDIINLQEIKEDWLNKVTTVFEEATLPVPQNIFMQQGGKKGMHTEHLGYILSEMQHLQRAYPGAEW
jgi:ring-1,2-phenylacetyl-CoA epoxidase subunit PaaC